jgi:hypothetical protein
MREPKEKAHNEVNDKEETNMQTSGLRSFARILLVLWAAYWIWFAAMAGLGDQVGAGQFALQVGLMALVVGGSTLIAWRWEAPGTFLLLLEGLVAAVGYPILVFGRFPLNTIVFVLATLAMPPLLAGLLLLLSPRKYS